MSLQNLQFWNCMDYGVVAVQKQFIGSMDYEVYTRDHGIMKGTYICTLIITIKILMLLIMQHQKTLQNISLTI